MNRPPLKYAILAVLIAVGTASFILIFGEEQDTRYSILELVAIKAAATIVFTATIAAAIACKRANFLPSLLIKWWDKLATEE